MKIEIFSRSSLDTLFQYNYEGMNNMRDYFMTSQLQLKPK